jgi:L-alanine-DL-glutamate epimerase-like enolase superfamily enzyme
VLQELPEKDRELLRMFFLEDVLNLEQLPWYHMLRQQTVTPQAAHEKLTSPSEYIPLISERLVDFIRFRISKVGGITPARKIAAMAELYGVRTAFQEGADNDPVNLAAAIVFGATLASDRPRLFAHVPRRGDEGRRSDRGREGSKPKAVVILVCADPEPGDRRRAEDRLRHSLPVRQGRAAPPACDRPSPA